MHRRSSFFAGKQNPVVAETLIQACLQVQGYDHTAQLAAGRAELYLQVHDGLVASTSSTGSPS